jgi:hypothetical protein
LDKIKSLRIAIPLLLLSFILGGWGSVGHKIINGNTVNSFPQIFQQFSSWKEALANHGSDADYRKGADPTEEPKHYIDFEDYNDFLTKGNVIQNYDSAVAKYGLSAITDAGSLPWVIVKCYDSLVQAFQQKDWNHALLLSADLGHYIADGNMPLHLSANYNGRPSLPNSSGIHSRYESTMIGKYSTSLPIKQNEAVYLTNVQDYIFSMVYKNYIYVDSVYSADSIAYVTAKSKSSDLYYSTLWNLTKNFTGMLFSNASEVLASVMYTAWINAGSPPLSPTFVEEVKNSAFGFSLEQNYPNPFNPSTVISYQVAVNGKVCLIVYDVLGNEVVTLVNEEKQAGRYNYELGIRNYELSSGVYFYQLRAGNFVQTKKMIYLK